MAVNGTLSKSHNSASRGSSRPMCPSTYCGCAALICVWFALVAIVCIPLGKAEVLPDLDERAPITEHECLVVSTRMQDRYRIRKANNFKHISGGKTLLGYTPYIEVLLVGQNTSVSATRYRDAEEVLEEDEAKAFISRFAVNSTVPCFQFNDGTVKLDRNPPDLSTGTYAFIVLAAFAICGLIVCFGILRLCMYCDSLENERRVTDRTEINIANVDEV